MTVALVAVCAALAALCALAVAGLIYFAKAALARADAKGASDTRAAVSDERVEHANESVGELSTELAHEKERSELLEKEAADAGTDVAGNPLVVLARDEGLERPE